MELKIAQEALEKKNKVIESRKKADSERFKEMVQTIHKTLDIYGEFCQTETSPPIFFLPKVHSEKSMDNLSKTKEKYEKIKDGLKLNLEEYLIREYPPDQQNDVKMNDDPTISEEKEDVLSGEESNTMAVES